MLASGLLVVHNTRRGGQDNVTELTGWKEFDDPLLEVTELNVVAGGNNTGLVETVGGEDISGKHSKCFLNDGNVPSIELDGDLSRAVVINLFELANVACERK